MTVNEIIWVLRRRGYNAEFIGEKVDFLFSCPFRFFAASKEIFDRVDEIERIEAIS
jgi:hypothetical protein